MEKAHGDNFKIKYKTLKRNFGFFFKYKEMPSINENQYYVISVDDEVSFTIFKS